MWQRAAEVFYLQVLERRMHKESTIGWNGATSTVQSTVALHHLGIAIIALDSDVARVRRSGTLDCDVVAMGDETVRQRDCVGCDGAGHAIHVAEAPRMDHKAVVASQKEESIEARIAWDGDVAAMRDDVMTHSS